MEDACVNKAGSFVSKLTSWVFECLDGSHPAWGPGRGILRHRLPEAEEMLGGWVIRFGVCLAADTVKRVLGCDLRCVPCLWVG